MRNCKTKMLKVFNRDSQTFVFQTIKMTKHRGKIIEKAVRACGIPLIKIAKRLHIDRGTLDNWFTYETHPIERLEKIGKVIHYDFSQVVPEMKKMMSVSEPMEKYGFDKDALSRILAEKDEQIQLLKKTVDDKEELIELLKSGQGKRKAG